MELNRMKELTKVLQNELDGWSRLLC